VLGVNAHVLVLKYGLDFREYREVLADARHMPEVRGAAPFLINEMMLAKGDRISGVLVKGVDPTELPNVLDLPGQMIAGTLDGLRVPGAAPPLRAGDLLEGESDGGLDRFLLDLRDDTEPPDAGGDVGVDDADLEALRNRIARSDGPLLAETPDGGVALAPELPPAAPLEGRPAAVDALPDVEVPTPEEMEALLAELEAAELPTDEEEIAAFEPDPEIDELLLPGVAGRPLPGIVVGKTLAENLGIEVGDRVTVISPLAGLDVSLWMPSARTPRSREFRVTGVFEAGFQEYDSRLVYVDIYEAQTFFDQGDAVTGVEIRLHDLTLASSIAARLERELGGGPFHTMDWEELNRNLFTALEIQKIMLSLVIATIIFVAAFNVIATLIMVVLEKRREIAILKAMGARDRTVLGIFLVQGTTIGLVGTLIGLLLGGAVCAYLANYEFPLDPKVYLIDHLPVRTSPWEFLWTVVIALAICVLATLAPSYWAARMLPADGVRHD
jgi:lipoprotein-releasing system permease protein